MQLVGNGGDGSQPKVRARRRRSGWPRAGWGGGASQLGAGLRMGSPACQERSASRMRVMIDDI